MKIKIIVLTFVGICLSSTSATAQQNFLLNAVTPSSAKANSENTKKTYYSLNNEIFSNPAFKKGVNFLVSNTSETYGFYIFDGKTGGFSSGVIIANETIFAADENGTGQVSFFGTGASVSPDVYGELKIAYNISNETIDYYYNGNLISQNSFLEGFTPGLVQILHRNQVSGTYLDVDDIEVKQLAAPYEWLSVPSMSGVSLEGESSQLELIFNTEGIDSGTYETLLKVTTNDPENPEFGIPVTLTVNEMVSNEPGEFPKQVSLNQNYPNPFNPSTTIRFNLSEPENVKLTVYNVQGQKVATLLNQRRSQGEHEIIFNADNFSSGVYIYIYIYIYISAAGGITIFNPQNDVTKITMKQAQNMQLSPSWNRALSSQSVRWTWSRPAVPERF